MAILRTEKRTYTLPLHMLRVTIAKLIELAPTCGSEPMAETAERTVGERSFSAIAFLAKALRADTEDDITEVLEDECKRFGGGALGAREVYLNITTLQSYLDTFYGALSARFLCEEHLDLAELQDTMAARYAEDDHGPPGEGDPSVTITPVQDNAARLFGNLSPTRNQ